MPQLEPSDDNEQRNYWWVNHKQTAKWEIGEGYLWSPETEANGARSQFYENMRRAAPGDIVVSYANGEVGHFGVVTAQAVTSPKPKFRNETGSNWDAQGWRLAVRWLPVVNAVRPKDHWPKLKHLFPEKYSPINASGNGNQKAYLAEVSEELIKRLAAICKFDLRPLRAEFNEDVSWSDVEQDVEQIKRETADETTRTALINARLGQGQFRRDLMRIWGRRCAVTGCDVVDILRASHVKPWKNSNNDERLDSQNGLLLGAHLDALFDAGLISFDDSGAMLVSKLVSNGAKSELRLGRPLMKTPSDALRRYLAFHREHVSKEIAE